jgi:hypothetical protein
MLGVFGGTRKNDGGGRRASSVSMSSSMFRPRSINDDRRTSVEDHRDGMGLCPTDASIANNDDRLKRSPFIVVSHDDDTRTWIVIVVFDDLGYDIGRCNRGGECDDVGK